MNKAMPANLKPATPELTPQQSAEVARLKMYFPYRICYGAIKGEEFISNTATTRRPLLKLAREGWTVFQAVR